MQTIQNNENQIPFKKETLDIDYSFIEYYTLKDGDTLTSVLKKTKQGSSIIRLLFKKIKEKPDKFIKFNDLKMFTKERRICDFIAGMTDRYAINLYKSLK